jgi:hypothetical protein
MQTFLSRQPFVIVEDKYTSGRMAPDGYQRQYCYRPSLKCMACTVRSIRKLVCRVHSEVLFSDSDSLCPNRLPDSLVWSTWDEESYASAHQSLGLVFDRVDFVLGPYLKDQISA